MRRTLLLAALLSAGTFVVAQATIAPSPTWQVPGAPHRGVSRLMSWDEQETVLVAQGKSQTLGNERPDRVRRILPVVLLWGLSAGQPSAMPYAAVAITLAGNLLLVAAVYRMTRSPFSALVLLLPPFFATTYGLLPTTLGLGLALWGWQTRNALLLGLSGFVHETFLAFALVRRRWAPVVCVGTWAVIVLVWLGNHERQSLGFLGLLHVHSPLNVVMLGLTLGMIPFAWRVSRSLTLVYSAYLVVLGPGSALYWTDFTRLLAPLWVLGFVGAVNGLHHHRAPRQVPRAADPADGLDVQLDPMPAARAAI